MAATLYDWGNLCHENVRKIMLLNDKCEGKYRQVIYCCYLTVAESAGTPQLILNLKRQFYRLVTELYCHRIDLSPIWYVTDLTVTDVVCHRFDLYPYLWFAMQVRKWLISKSFFIIKSTFFT